MAQLRDSDDWSPPSAAPPFQDRPQSVESGSNLTHGGGSGPTPDESLTQYLQDQIEPGHWEVTDPGSADWALRKLGKVDAEAHAVSDLAEQQIAAIEAWRGAEHKRLGTQRENWETLLTVYHRGLWIEDEKVKTIRLPHGTLTARKLPDNIEIEDVKTALAWALACNDDYVRFPEPELNRAALKEAVLKNGEIIPGVTATVGAVRFTVSTDTPN